MFKEVNIHWYPDLSLDNEQQVTIGDLHANALLLVYFLIRHRVLKISEPQYLQLVNIYQSMAQNPQEYSLFREFLIIIHEAKVDKKPFIRFIGDELADRGVNDLLILFILKKLQEHQVPYRILLSNHGLCFLSRYTALVKDVKQQNPMVPFKASVSFDMLEFYYHEDYINLTMLKTWVHQAYLDYLELFDYSLDGHQITIYTHGISGIEQFKELAQEFNIRWQDHDLVSLALTLEQLKKYFKQNVLYKLLDAFVDTAKDDWEVYEKKMQWLRGSRMIFLCENRSISSDLLTRPEIHQTYQMKYVHGHHPEENPPKNVVSLDGFLGKHSKLHQGFLMEYLCVGEDVKSYRAKLYTQIKLPMNRIVLPCLGIMAFGYFLNSLTNTRFSLGWMQEYITFFTKELNSTNNSQKLTF